MDSVPSSGSKKPAGFHDNSILLFLALHTQHCFAIDHGRTRTGQTRLFRQSQHDLGFGPCQPVSKTFCCCRLALHSPISHRTTFQNHSSRDTKSWSELNHAVLWTDCQRIEHLPCEFNPAWSQHTLACTCQYPMSLHLVRVLPFPNQWRINRRYVFFAAVNARPLHHGSPLSRVPSLEKPRRYDDDFCHGVCSQTDLLLMSDRVRYEDFRRNRGAFGQSLGGADPVRPLRPSVVLPFRVPSPIALHWRGRAWQAGTERHPQIQYACDT